MRKKIKSLLIIFLCILMTNVIAVSNITGNNIGNVINDETKQEIIVTSESYIVSKENLIISRILPNTTIKEFKSKFNIDKNKVHVYDKEGKQEKQDGYIGTEMQIKFDGCEDIYIASVIGDITGNGKIEQIEVSKAIKHVIGLKEHQITGIAAVSTDVSGDGIIDQKDVSILIKYVVTGKLDIGDLLRPASPTINVTSGTEGKNKWYTSNVTIEIKGPEESVIPFTNMIVEIKGNLNQEATSIPNGSIINIEEEGIYEIKTYTISAAGVKSAETTKTIKIDKTAPTSAELIGKFKNEYGNEYKFDTISFQNIYLETTSGKDENSGIESVTIEATGDNIIKPGTKAPVILENNGTTNVKVTTTNKAGLSSEKTYTVMIDKIIKNPGRVITKLNNAEGEEYIRDTWTNQDVYVEIESGPEEITTTYQVEGANTVARTTEPTTLTKEGISTITVINEDTYGNVSKTSIIVKIDKTAPSNPTLNVTGTKILQDSNWYVEDALVKFTVENEQTGSNIKNIEYEIKDLISNEIQKDIINNGGDIRLVFEGVYELKATSVDIAGNKSESTVVYINIDKTNPIAGTMILKKNNQDGGIYEDNTWTNQNIYMQLENGNDTLSGHKSTVYKITGPQSTENITESTLINEDGTYTITVTTTDMSGRTAERTYTIKIDTQAPEKPTYEIVEGTKENSESEWYSSNVTLKVLQGNVDAGNSGIARTTYQISGKSTVEETEISNEGTISLEEEGIYDITLYNYDVAGNKSEANTFTIKIDKTNPIAGTMILRKNNQNGEDYINGSWTNQDVYIELENGTDTLPEGLTTVYRVSGEISTEELTEPAKLTREGIYTITVTTTDLSGRTAERIYTVKIDKQSPDEPKYEVIEGTKQEENNEWYISSVIIKVLQGNVDAGNSGIARTTYQISGRNTVEETEIVDEGTITLEEEGIYNVTLNNYDVAGNKSESNTFVIKIDKTNPTAGTMILKKNNQDGENYTNNTWTNQDVYLELEEGTDTLPEGLTTVYTISGPVNTENLTEPSKLTKEGIYTITVTTTDLSGRFTQRIYTVKIDKHAPEKPTYEIVQGNKSEPRNEWYNGNVTIRVLQGTTDLGDSGIHHTTYEISGKMENSETNIQDQGTINVTEDGIYYITAYNYDTAGNKSEGNTITIKLDKTAPQDIQINTPNITGTQIYTTISATEDESGIVLYQVYVDGNLYREIETGEEQVNCNIINQSSGRHTILVKIKDLAGNENQASKEVNMGRLDISDIECIEFMIKDFTKTKNGANVGAGSEYIVSDTSVSEVAKYIQVSTSDNQTTGEITGSIRVIRKDGSIVDEFEYYPESLVISIAQYSDGSGSTWSHEAGINMANTELTNSGVLEGTSRNRVVNILEKQNSDNRFIVKDKKLSGTKTYTRLIIKEITANGIKVPFKITSNIM